MKQGGMVELYQEGLLSGIVSSRLKKLTGFTSLSKVTISPDMFKSLKRSVRWILTHSGVDYKISDTKLMSIMRSLDVSVK